MENNANYKSGFVALIGRPNVGKSTLMNHLIGQKIAITSKKPQTTRNRIQTVYTCDEGQIVFLDTPGIHKAKNKLGGGSEDNGIGSVAGNVPVVMAKLFESMKEATGVDLSEIMRADTYDAKVNRNIQISSPEELKEYLKAEAGKAAADAESPEKAEASEPVQKDGSEQ